MKHNNPNSTVVLALALALAVLSGASLHAQAPADSVVAIVADAQGLPFVPVEQRPQFSTYWEARNSFPCITVPLPWVPEDPSLAVYALGGGQFLVDETAGPLVGPLAAPYGHRVLGAADYAAIVQGQVAELQELVAQVQAWQLSGQAGRNAQDMVAPPAPPGGDDGTNDWPGGWQYNTRIPTTNDLWLAATMSGSNRSALLVIHPPWNETNVAYDLFMTTNLSPYVPGLNLTNWVWLRRTEPGETNIVVPHLWRDQAYFILGRTNDTDGDGMSDAYEQLVSHTDPNVPDGPVITFQPLSQTVWAGDSAAFTVIAEGAQPLAYQWMLNGTNLAGATGASLTLAAAEASQGGDYSVVVTSPVGLSVLSSNATLSVQGSWGYYFPVFGPRQDFTFKSGHTYLILWPVQLYGQTTIQGGSVIKFDTWQNSTIQIMGTLVAEAKPYYPAILTCADDISAGDDTYRDDSDGSPVMVTNGLAYLDLTCCQNERPAISNLRFCYADQAVTTPFAAAALDVWDCQFVQCNVGVVNGITNTPAADRLHNVLFAGCQTAVLAVGTNSLIAGEHITADVATFWTGPAPPARISLTNSVIIGTLDPGPVLVTDHCAINPAGPVFQTNGTARYYLSGASPYRGAGTPAVSPRLLAEFGQKTTWPPLAFPACMNLAGDLTLGPQAGRYTNGAPDYGFYYDALDYTVAWMTTWGAITVLPGTAIGFRNEYAAAQGYWTLWGFDLHEGSSFTSHGTPARPNTFSDVQLVQEQFEIPCLAAFIPDFWPNADGNAAPSLDLRFCNFYVPQGGLQGGNYLLWAGYDLTCWLMQTPDSLINWNLRDCNLHGGWINLGPPDDGNCFGAPMDYVYGSGSVSWVNNLFDGVSITLDPTYYWYNGATNCDLSFEAHNNLFRGGLWFTLSPIPASAGNWVLTDNLFDKVNFVQDTNAPLDFQHNAYWPLAASELDWASTLWCSYNQGQWSWFGYPECLPNAAQLSAAASGTSSNELVLTGAPRYQTGPLGDYYLPPAGPLFGGGSRTAADAGLYHYTTRRDQRKEGEEASGHKVNIGLHYIATAGRGSSQPRDTDGDGIPDYVEDANGNGIWDPETETDWQNAMTDGVTPDAYSTVYDDLDLSGSGLVGRIKKALGVEPFDTSNPLKLTPLITGEEPDFATFEVPVSYDAVSGSGTLSLKMNGVDVTLEECTRATNGDCLLSFNVDYDPAGLHYLSAGFRLGTEPASPQPVTTADGAIQPYCSSNSVQFYVNASMFDDAGAYLDAKLFVPAADYTIDLYDPSTTPPTWILSITNSTSNGMIQEDWGTTNADGTPFTGATVQAVFSVTPSGTSSNANALPGHPSKILTCATNSLSECGPNFDVAYMYTPTNGSLRSAFGNPSGIPGAVWLGMQSVVDALLTPLESGGGSDNHYNSSFNRYTGRDFPTQSGFPGYVTSRADITNTLLPDLTNGLTRQFYCYAHGTAHTISSLVDDASISEGEVSSGLGNSYTKTNLITQKPYRFVFLDACSTASSMDWSRAFGIYPMNEAPRDKVGPQAFVGWAAPITGWMDGSGDPAGELNLAKAYTKTLQMFYSYWMYGKSLKECIHYVSDVGYDGAVQFPVPENKRIVVYGPGYEYHFTNVLTSKIYVIGHSGLTRSGVKSQDDNSYSPPTNTQ